MADQIDVGPPPVRLSSGRSRKGVVVAAVVIALAAAAAFAWFSYGDRMAELSGAPAPSGSVGDSVAATEFTAFQAETSASLQSTKQLLAAQQTELKRLSDQVAGLTSRIDGLQGSIAAAAPVAPPTAAAPVAAAPAAPRPTAPRKRPAAPAGAISVGGAPLPGTAPSAR